MRISIVSTTVLVSLALTNAAAQTPGSPVPEQPSTPGAVTPGGGQGLADFATELVKVDRKLGIARAELESAELKQKAAWGDWAPELSLTRWQSVGKEKTDYVTAAGTDSNLKADETDFKVTQLLWDFGKTNSKIRSSESTAELSRNAYVIAEQSLLLDASSAYINLYRSMTALALATDAERALLEQLTLEQKRKEAGAGVATDVLQAQAQLQGAQARRVRAQIASQQAQFRFVNIFGRLPSSLESMRKPTSPNFSIPESLESAVKIGLDGNPTMRAAKLATALAIETRRQSTASMLPKIEAVYDKKEKDNVSGTAGRKEETLTKLNVTWTFNLGFKDYYTNAANAKLIVGSEAKEVDALRNAQEEISSAYRTLMLTRQSAAVLSQQVESSEKFVELAKREREVGKRSLLDVLAGEATLSGAKADAFSAEMDVLLSTYSLLKAMGKLELSRLAK
jgi:adhesin transport system outer membrane protein